MAFALRLASNFCSFAIAAAFFLSSSALRIILAISKCAFSLSFCAFSCAICCCSLAAASACTRCCAACCANFSCSNFCCNCSSAISLACVCASAFNLACSAASLAAASFAKFASLIRSASNLALFSISRFFCASSASRAIRSISRRALSLAFCSAACCAISAASRALSVALCCSSASNLAWRSNSFFSFSAFKLASAFWRACAANFSACCAAS